MNDKFLRESRNYASLFFIEYKEDPNAAVTNLIERLKGKRIRVQEMTMEIIRTKLPGVI